MHLHDTFHEIYTSSFPWCIHWSLGIADPRSLAQDPNSFVRVSAALALQCRHRVEAQDSHENGEVGWKSKTERLRDIRGDDDDDYDDDEDEDEDEDVDDEDNEEDIDDGSECHADR